jgi:hypothetical protein
MSDKLQFVAGLNFQKLRHTEVCRTEKKLAMKSLRLMLISGALAATFVPAAEYRGTERI